MNKVQFILNNARKDKGPKTGVADFNPEEAAEVRAFLQSFPGYAPTPLVPMPNLAAKFGLKLLTVKDESKRFGLNAFKAVGGAWAIAKYLCARLNLPIKGLTLEALKQATKKAGLSDLTFATATDGNHGRGVAWVAAQLGCKAKIYMPKGSAKARADNIRKTGAECLITEFNYDDTVRMLAADAEKNNWVRIQDTAAPGYEDIPLWIMQGYMAVAVEALEDLQMHAAPLGIKAPTHLFLQAGVGSFPAAILGFFAAVFSNACPVTTIVEPLKAACIFESIKAGDGTPHAVTGPMDTIMAGLACGEPSTIAWKIIKDYAAAAAACPEYTAANGMRILAAPGGGDTPVTSGESGAVTCGLLEFIMCREEGKTIRDTLGLNAESVVMLISTEGDTEPEMYRKVVWEGKFSEDQGE